jgi:hypothetical protein
LLAQLLSVAQLMQRQSLQVLLEQLLGFGTQRSVNCLHILAERLQALKPRVKMQRYHTHTQQKHNYRQVKSALIPAC